jgi:glycosyltransferase involved in cell wall biosynthesis
MNILILSDGIPPEGKGGAERIAWESARLLASAGHSVSVLTTTQRAEAKGKPTTVATLDGITVYTHYTTYHPRWRAWISLYNPGAVKEVRKIIRAIQPDIVHAHNIHAYLSYGALGAVRKEGIPVLLTVHDVMSYHYGKLPLLTEKDNGVCPAQTYYRVSAWNQFTENTFRYNPFRNVIIRYYLRSVTQIFAVSAALKEALRQNAIQQVQVLYNFINESEWSVSTDECAQFITRLRLTDKKIILFGGRVTSSKGGDALLEAFRLVHQEVPSAVVVLMGTENDYVRRLLARAEDMGIRECIVTTGWISGRELAAAYHAATVVTVPSLIFDSLTMISLEAMACGKPVVGSCSGGIPETIERGVTGQVIHPLNTKEYAEVLIDLLTQPEKAAQWGTAGSLLQQERFSQEAHLATLMSAYEKAVR